MSYPPADHSISVVKLPDSTLLGKVTLDATAYSVACYGDGGYKAVVSTFNNVPHLVDLDGLSEIQHIASLPEARGLHAISVLKFAILDPSTGSGHWFSNTAHIAVR